MEKNFIAVRGAVTVDKNSAEEISSSVVKLLKEICRANNIEKKDIVSIYFTLTEDIDRASPATVARHAGLVEEYTALFCMQEAKVEGAIPMCVRVLVNAQSLVLQRFVRHIYLGRARQLRPDLFEKHFQIAIDGPSGAGKTTVARLIANRMNIFYLDTGAIYRTIAVGARRLGVNPVDQQAVESVLSDIEVGVQFAGKNQKMLLAGQDVSEAIRQHSVSADASDISKHQAVRNFVTEICRETAAHQSIVMEGRDICGYVLPDADVKIFLDAKVEVRATRRFEELSAKGQSIKYEDILSDIQKRDHNDMNRQNAPLRQTEDSLYIDCTYMTVEDILEKVLEAAG